jgi:hypothetical protein
VCISVAHNPVTKTSARIKKNMGSILFPYLVSIRVVIHTLNRNLIRFVFRFCHILKIRPVYFNPHLAQFVIVQVIAFR